MTHVVSSTATLELYMQHNKNQRLTNFHRSVKKLTTFYPLVKKLTFHRPVKILGNKIKNTHPTAWEVKYQGGSVSMSKESNHFNIFTDNTPDRCFPLIAFTCRNTVKNIFFLRASHVMGEGNFVRTIDRLGTSGKCWSCVKV